MKRPRSTPRRVEGLLEAVLGRASRGRDWRPYRIWMVWNEVVGANIARRAQPERFSDGVLVVHVESHSWLQELQLMRHDIVAKLNQQLGETILRDITFVAGRVTPPAEVDLPASQAPPAASPVVLPAIADPELAAAFERLNLARARRRR